MTHAAIRNPRVAERIFGTPLLVEPRKAAAILWGLTGRVGDVGSVVCEGAEVAARDHFVHTRTPLSQAALQQEMGVVANRLRGNIEQRGELPFDMVDDAAIITIEGSLIHKGKFVGTSSGETSYEGLSAQIQIAANDPRVGGIVLEVDSFGGEAQGAFDLTDMVFEARQAKPIWAILTENACSAGYALASAADQVVIPRTGYAGSIGVVMLHADFSEALDKAGINITMIHAGSHKVDGNPYEPLPESVRDAFKASAESTRDIFVETIGRNRGARLTAQAARETEAAVFEGQCAVDAGIADAVAAPLDALGMFLEHLRPSVAASAKGRLANNGNQRKGSAMSIAKTITASARALALRASQDPEDEVLEDENEDEAPVDDEDEDLATESDDETAEGDDDDEEMEAEGGAGTEAKSDRASERKRISAITSAPEAKGRESQAQHLAFETDMPAKDAIAVMAVSAKGGQLADRMDSAGKHNIGSGAPSTSGGDRASEMLSAFKGAGGGYQIRED